jgi:hypothetical protein
MTDGGDNERDKEYKRGLFESRVLSTLENIQATLADFKIEQERVRLELETKVSKEVIQMHEERIVALEKWRWMLGGALVLAGTLGGVFGNLIFDAIIRR